MTLSDVAKLYTDYTWLDGPTGNPTTDKILHWGAIATGSLISWAAESLGGTPGAWAPILEPMNIVADIFKDPNIAGIPIKAEIQRTSRSVDVSKQMLVAQDSGSSGGKEWIVDNAAPRPLTWSIKGYLKTLSSIVDGLLIIKPTLQLQLHLLDYYASSRRPVWFKAHYSLFYQVLIEHFEYEFDPKIHNAVAVTLSLCEYKVNIAHSNMAGIEQGLREQDPDALPDGAQLLNRWG